MHSLYKIFVLALSMTYLLGFQSQALDDERQNSRSTKRDRTRYESDDLEPGKRQGLDNSPPFTPFRSRDRNSQFRILTQQSPFVEGEESARLRWVRTLDIFSGSKKPHKFTEIPADIHGELAYVGNHLRAFAARYPTDPRFPFKRNILVPHVSFVVKRPGVDGSLEKFFIPGSYINFDEERYAGFATAFISGADMPWDAFKPFNAYRKKNNSKGTDYDFPLMRVFSGKEVERMIGKKLPSAEQTDPDQVECRYHTEEMFYEMLLANPRAVVTQAEKVLWPIDEIVHIVFDIFSWWDVCRPCQKRFRTEYFRGVVHQKLEQEFAEAGFDFSQDTGILPVFRVSSYKQHHPDSLRDMANAGGGSQVQGGFDATVLSQAQVVLSTRKTTGAFDYPAILQRIQVH